MAFINVLDYSRGPVLDGFLKLCRITPQCPLEKYSFSLHEGYKNRDYQSKTPFLVEITPRKEEFKRLKSGIRTKEPIHDARIKGENEVLFLYHLSSNSSPFPITLLHQVSQGYLQKHQLPDSLNLSLSPYG